MSPKREQFQVVDLSQETFNRGDYTDLVEEIRKLPEEQRLVEIINEALELMPELSTEMFIQHYREKALGLLTKLLAMNEHITSDEDARAATPLKKFFDALKNLEIRERKKDSLSDSLPENNNRGFKN